ncbi:MGH1-like glycoside hydrolase domain-containing protein [Pontivivens insulae]|uniref:Mannosylglycerate hydrolase MGH1-like glycoside hydrolase domain-containing protein n=1 Tax=Pontivivens insulae TaxID=1639689 RepID=A0A2R8A722_9RHOB|nr:trehalase family glycosidase [Pontivivens insulae]RED18088.1 trehalase [Pontivivens insulae]SPF27985.1 hypothetical protein POI8812_00280 [Pontivivens insulae]
MTKDLIAEAKNVLRLNDRGAYTVPTHGLYPFQWNWDSALSALGFVHFDEARAWTEIDTLMSHQWPCGMVPHIIFHEHDDGYFPGPDVWQTARPVATSGITQPPVSGYAVARLMDMARDKSLAEERARALLPSIHAWHKWFYRTRDPRGEGLVAIIHPWESGRDNSIDWDAPFAAVPTDGVEPYTRRDTMHANPDHRPTKEQYDRYIWLVQHFRSLKWDTEVLHDASPFRVVDPGFNAILIRSCAAVAELAAALGEGEIAKESRAMAAKGTAALDQLWSDTRGQYLCYDRAKEEFIDSPSIGGLLTVFAPIPEGRAQAIADRLNQIGKTAEFLVPSHDPVAPEFDGARYWRGPVWLIMNTMISDGLAQAGQHVMSQRLMDDSLRLIEKSGFAEYYDPITAEPCGGGHFTWTAAMVIDILYRQEQVA